MLECELKGIGCTFAKNESKQYFRAQILGVFYVFANNFSVVFPTNDMNFCNIVHDVL